MKLVYGLKDGETVHVSKVTSGLACGCVCPACGEQLVAKKGSKRDHHFAHRGGKNCEYGYQTSLHLAAKEIISRAKKFVIPQLLLKFPNPRKLPEQISPSREIPIDDVKLEQRFGDVIPDIVLISGGKELFVEIFVTHKIDDIKIAKIKKSNISTIEIDLSAKREMLSEEELSEIVLGDSELKVWKYNACEQEKLSKFYKVSEERKVISDGSRKYVTDCPLAAWKFKNSPRVEYHCCLFCEYCISTLDVGEIRCTGHSRISILHDFKVPKEKRIQDSNNRLVAQQVMDMICPNCGSRLVPGADSTVVCENCKNCKFKATIDNEMRTVNVDVWG